MNANFIFVHGTGVRQPAYRITLKKIRKHLKKEDKSFPVYECYWGDECGSKLNEGGKSIPTFDTNRSVGGYLSDKDYKIALWHLLYQNPFFELEILSLREPENNYPPPSQELPGKGLDESIRNFTPPQELLDKLAEAGIKEEIFQQARDRIIEDTNYQKAINQAQQSTMGDYRQAIAKALVAQSAILVSETYGAQALCLMGDSRDQIVTEIVSAIGGSERGVVDWVKNLLQEKLPKLLDSAVVTTTNGILQIPTGWALRKRGSLSQSIAATAGDVIMYQSRGQKIRDFIQEKIKRIQGHPVILIAHSLGGIAAVDLLLEPDPPKVDLLVTIGSQAPLLYEWNALTNMEHQKGANLPNTFPKWLNIYDERDFLSYIGAGIFPGKVEDIKVSNGQPFPASHGAYWNNPNVWSAIFERIPK
ncbi:lipase family alpha/beta hydrolase [Microcystis aeruginosa]|uniref:lipase family alpha/beta hydrolase n=1 Tax=Microcystis aeruginosa TaxID=1126 RepID=UPI00210D61C6|nr:GPI inositol-deacylase [Microcystis aeruginosa]